VLHLSVAQVVSTSGCSMEGWVTKRRPMGSLEAEILDCLWRADAPLTPGDVQEALGDHGLAYTTVMTILTRLWRKGLAERAKQGRAFAYSATITEADFAATRMQAMLQSVTDRQAAMSRFVDGLDPREAIALRKALEDLDR
jgi:predicted transcriptional regulator